MRTSLTCSSIVELTRLCGQNFIFKRVVDFVTYELTQSAGLLE